MNKIVLNLLFGFIGLFVSAQNEFVSTWKTDNPGVSANNQIIIPIYYAGTYDYSVEWGDGTTSNVTIAGDITHTYSVPGIYTVSITGDFPGFYFSNSGDKEKIISVDQWGSIEWASMQQAFHGCSNLDIVANDVPDTSQVVSTNQMFANCSSLLGTPAFNDWDTVNVTDMDSMFSGCTLFNQDIGNWDVSRATQMGGLFLNASSFNQDIGNWDVGKVENMTFMFGGATAFNQPIGNWNVANVSSMGWMFNGASSFNQSINNWNVGNVTIMQEMFSDAPLFNQPIGSWNVGNVTNMSAMFYRSTSFNQDIGNWNVSKVENMSYLFYYAYRFNQDISNWDVAKVTNMSDMFNGATDFNKNLDIWNVGNVTDMSRMFQYAYSFNGDVGSWNVENVLEMDYMFHRADGFDQEIGSWDVSNVKSMSAMFKDASLSVENYDKLLSGWSGLSSLQSEIYFVGGNSQFCDGESARQFLIDTYNWTITDGGKNVFCNLDTDNDGVPDHLDQCLDTPLGATVNTKGCQVLPANNFTIQSIGETCPDKNNAIVKIEAVWVHDYVATINGTAYNFAKDLIINNLNPGSYEVCISLASKYFEQCYTVELSGASDISGKSWIENGKFSMNIDQGTAPYHVSVNGRPLLQTNLSAFSIDVRQGDFVEITTDKICEGSLTKTIEEIGALKAFPNPTTGIFEIALPIFQNEVTIDVLTVHSQLISTSNLPAIDGKVKMDISELPQGVYLVKVHYKSPITFKIVKQ